MPREVHPDDFSDDYLNDLFDSVSRLVWSSDEKVPAWVEEEAEAFAGDPPRASPAEMRDHIRHAVIVARGWDDPDDPRTILHSALKAYYLIQWVGRLARHQGNRKLDLSYGYKVSFTPTFHNESSVGTPPALKSEPETDKESS